jgi:hypothetical protein
MINGKIGESYLQRNIFPVSCIENSGNRTVYFVENDR